MIHSRAFRQRAGQIDQIAAGPGRVQIIEERSGVPGERICCQRPGCKLRAARIQSAPVQRDVSYPSAPAQRPSVYRHIRSNGAVYIQTTSIHRRRTRIATAITGQGKVSRSVFSKRAAAADSRGTIIRVAVENQRAVVADIASHIAVCAPDFERAVRDSKSTGIVIVPLRTSVPAPVDVSIRNQ